MIRLEAIFTEEFKQYDCETKTEILRTIFMRNNTQTFQKTGMEFCYIYGFFNILEELIAKNRQSAKQDNREWSRIYEILLDIQRGKKQFLHWLDELEQMNRHSPETVCLIQLTEVNIATHVGNMDVIKSAFHTFYQNYQKMGDRILAFYFSLRFRTYKLLYFFKRHDLITLRMKAYAMLKEASVPTISAIVHIFLGASYIVNCYDQVLFHFRKALQIAETNRLEYLIIAIEDTCFPFAGAHQHELTNTQQEDSFSFELIETNGKSRIDSFAILDSFPIDRFFSLMTESEKNRMMGKDI